MSEAQKKFDELYISSKEILKRLNVTRATVSQAKKRGTLPEPIVVNNSSLWERKEVEPALQSWEASMRAKHP